MVHRKKLSEDHGPETIPAVLHEVNTAQEVEKDKDVCRVMYEQIALGNMLADIEEEARLMWIPEGEGYLNQKRRNYEIKTKQTL